MLSVTNLTKTYGTQVVFDQVSFTVGDGERIGLVGRNGSGKTTLLRLITGEETPDAGSLNIPRGYTIGYLSQTLSFAKENVLAEAASVLPRHEDGTDETYKVKAVLSGLGFGDSDFYRPPAELSSGFRVRLSLAKALVSSPDLLLLDEPTNYLDILSVRWLGRFLKEWRSQLILITHDRSFMDEAVSHVIGIHGKGVRKIAGSTHKLYAQILMEEEVYEKTRVNDERKRKELEQFINRFRAQATRARAVQSRIRMLGKKEELEKLQGEKMLDFQFPAAPFSGKWLMEVRDLSFAYDGGAPLIDGLTFPIARRDRIGVIGKNGKGKTTLLGLLAGGLKPVSGNVGRAAALRASYFGQAGIDGLNPDATVEEEITHASLDSSRGSSRDICGLMLFEGDLALKKITVLSGGEKSRVLLGKLLVTPSNLLLLDEPTNHLDMESIDSLIEAIDEFEGAVVLATHSEMILRAVANRLVVFDGGPPWLFEGSYEDFLERVGWQDEQAVTPVKGDRTVKKVQRAERKEIKRMRAGIISERSRMLSPLAREIDRLEKTIMGLEKRIEEDNAALVRASAGGQGKAIASLSVSIYEAKGMIDRLFAELESASSAHAERAREFETKLAALSEGPAIE